MFGKFKFSPWQMFKDALVIEWLSSFKNFFKFKSIQDVFDRKKIIDEANKRFKGELDIKKILLKIRNANDMIETLMTAKDKNISKISKERVIDTEELLKPPSIKGLIPMITKQVDESDGAESDISLDPIITDSDVDPFEAQLEQHFGTKLVMKAYLKPEEQKNIMTTGFTDLILLEA